MLRRMYDEAIQEMIDNQLFKIKSALSISHHNVTSDIEKQSQQKADQSER